MTVEFGEAFERLRIGRGLSPAELARELDEYEGNVSRWRRGGGIDIGNARKIADYFGVERGWLEGLAGYPPGTATDTPADPRLAALTASIASGWLQMDEAARDLAERGTRALFAIPTTASGGNSRHRDGGAIRRSGGRRILDPHTRATDDQGLDGGLPTVYAYPRRVLAFAKSYVKQLLEPSNPRLAAQPAQ